MLMAQVQLSFLWNDTEHTILRYLRNSTIIISNVKLNEELLMYSYVHNYCLGSIHSLWRQNWAECVMLGKFIADAEFPCVLIVTLLFSWEEERGHCDLGRSMLMTSSSRFMDVSLHKMVALLTLT